MTSDIRTEEQRNCLMILLSPAATVGTTATRKRDVPPMLNHLQASGLELDVVFGVILARGVSGQDPNM
jgi:hypothetical protein